MGLPPVLSVGYWVVLKPAIIRDIISLACLYFSSWLEESKRHLSHKPKKLPLVPFAMEEQWLDSEPLPNDCGPHDTSKGDPSRPSGDSSIPVHDVLDTTYYLCIFKRRSIQKIETFALTLLSSPWQSYTLSVTVQITLLITVHQSSHLTNLWW